jgi:hypothetical protein
VDIKNSSGTVLVNVNSSGSVGVGTNSPLQALDVLNQSGQFGQIAVRDGSLASQPSYNAGIAAELSGSSMIDFGVNDDTWNRFGGAYNTSMQGGYLRVDTRSGLALFQYSGRQANSGSSGSWIMALTSSGYLGIPTTNPQAPLDVEATASLSYSNYQGFNAGGNGHVSGTGTYNVSIKTAGTIWVGGEVDVTSDRRAKENIVKIDPQKALQFVEKSKPVFFKWKDQDRTNYGFIAQDLLKLGFDPLVVLVPDEKMTQTVDEDGFVSPAGAKFSVNYEEIPALLTTALKNISDRVLRLEREDVDQQIVSLQAENAELKLNYSELENENALMKTYVCKKNPSAPFCQHPCQHPFGHPSGVRMNVGNEMEKM